MPFIAVKEALRVVAAAGSGRGYSVVHGGPARQVGCSISDLRPGVPMDVAGRSFAHLESGVSHRSKHIEAGAEGGGGEVGVVAGERELWDLRLQPSGTREMQGI